MRRKTAEKSSISHKKGFSSYAKASIYKVMLNTEQT